MLRAQLKDSELKSILTDNTQVPTARPVTCHPHHTLPHPYNQTRDRTAAILDEHRDTQRQEKAADPARFIPERKKASSPPVGRTASRPMPSGQDAPLGVVEFKEVQVRAIDPKTLAAVRASRRCVPQQPLLKTHCTTLTENSLRVTGRACPSRRLI